MNNKGLKTIATIAGLLVIIAGVVAGVVETRDRSLTNRETLHETRLKLDEHCVEHEGKVKVLERDVDSIAKTLEKHAARQEQQFDEIQKSLHAIDKKQTALTQKIENFTE